MTASVGQALPTYAMGCYLLPNCVISELNGLLRDYWWTGRIEDHGWPLLAWSSICKPKRKGGLGFRDLRAFNMALLGKQVWHLFQQYQSLMSRVLASIDSNIRMFSEFWGATKPILFGTVHHDNAKEPVRCGEFMNTVRVFGWRLATDSLPTGSGLLQAGLGDGKCPICGVDLETTLHVVRDCVDATVLLSDAGFTAGYIHTDHTSCQNWLIYLMHILPLSHFVDMLGIAYMLWTRRNLLVHEGKMTPGWHLISEVRSLQAAYAQFHPTPDPFASHLRPAKWRKPPLSTIKINADGDVSFTGVLAVGILARDETGMITGKALSLAVLGEACIAEAYAITIGLQLGLDLGGTHIVIESDAANLIRQLQRRTLELSVVRFQLEEALCLLQAHSNLRVTHVRRPLRAPSWWCNSSGILVREGHRCFKKKEQVD
ncbi:hypothetical protein F3Y22_tig00110332pilonHSYRG00843 [Hibiscus syriacus]|uniref:RNase H type-1 domain-containing protein n=1 Tax=Hibiscus syriacus TaxID=106335 RepID=A0A6A3AWU1_HIBSY|nr:hypothetical protein F3Y22_tig00110332pilonHSYRG00843 [Hibiscus syriacus]